MALQGAAEVFKASVRVAIFHNGDVMTRENCVILIGGTTSGKSWLFTPFSEVYICHAKPPKDSRFALLGAGWARAALALTWL